MSLTPRLCLRKNTGLVASVLLLTACQAPPSPGRPPSRGELIASQLDAFAMPPTDDRNLVVHASMAAIAWSKLEPDQLEAWAAAWWRARVSEPRPSLVFTVLRPGGEETTIDMFERSPRDGFCLAYADWKLGRLRNDDLRAFFDGLELR